MFLVACLVKILMWVLMHAESSAAPPCVVTMHVESLEDWITREQPEKEVAMVALAGLYMHALHTRVFPSFSPEQLRLQHPQCVGEVLVRLHYCCNFDSRREVLKLCCFAGVAKALAKLHEAGYVYLNTKPSDVAWDIDTESWQLLDFSRTVPVGACTFIVFKCKLLMCSVLLIVKLCDGFWLKM